jgi:ABC-type hemin transport system ATPase subunit
LDERLQRTIYERLQQDGSIDEDWSLYVIAACGDAGDLDAVLEGAKAETPTLVQAEAESTPLGAYLKSITVQGFRGIGPETTLELTPGPGLTLVVGRNGSGKSSFAEGLEVLFTGDSKRWAGRVAVWKEGWRNLHHPHPAVVDAQLLVEGVGEVIVTRSWEADARIEDSSVAVQPKGKARTNLDFLGWEQALISHRPFLSYNELGSLLDEGPSKLYDALSLVLGLEELVEALGELAQARLQRTRALDAVKRQLPSIVASLESLVEETDNERAKHCLSALSTKTWDLEAVAVQVFGTEKAPPSDVELLRRAASIEPIDMARTTAVAKELRRSAAELESLKDSDTARAQGLVTLLVKALEHHEHHSGPDCPVCKSRGVLDNDWRIRTEEEIARLRNDASAYESAAARLKHAHQGALDLIDEPPTFLSDLGRVGILVDEITEHWEQWYSGRALAVDDLPGHLESRPEDLNPPISILVDAARAELKRREDRWRPVAEDLGSWVQEAEEARKGVEQVPGLKAAEKWLKEASSEIRSDRFAPIGTNAMAIWEHLRQQSSVELGDIQLLGSGTNRRVTLDVKVDGVGGAALGVMSQGELHSLALSLFLPRATLPESPFRFVVIDDPVQSMDPSRVDGLARALEETAKSRQVVVFTHDERLPSAVRRLDIEARIVGVTRRTASVVELREALHPVKAYIDDAFALINTKELPEDVRNRVVPGFCRSAIEAACHEVIRRRSLTKGLPNEEVEDRLAQAGTLSKTAALAFFDDENRAGDVMNRLNQWGSWAGDSFKRVNKGAHEGYSGDLSKLAHDVQSLCKRVLVMK